MENTLNKRTVKFFNGKELPLEMHKVRVVQSLNLVPVERRLEAIREAVSIHSFLELRIFSWTCSPTAEPTR